MPLRLSTRAIVPALLLALAGGGGARAGDAGAVRAELLVDDDRMAPGMSFQVGVHLTIPPGWHVYWRYPGDSGIATAVRFEAPPGFTVGPLRWPVPERFQQPGEEVAFGYTGEVLLSAEVRAPAAIPLQTRITALADWLCCSDVCVPGHAALEIALPFQRESFSRPPVQRAPFEALGRALPSDHPPEVAGVTVTGRPGGDLRIDVRWREAPAAIDFFPAPADAIEVSRVECSTDGLVTHIGFRATRRAGFQTSAATLECVVAYTTKTGERRGLRVAAPLGEP